MSSNKKTKVFMLGWEFPPHNSGGLGVACLGLAQALTDQDVDITFVLPKKIDNVHDIRLLFANVPNISFDGIDTGLVPYITSGEYDERLRHNKDNIYGVTLFEEALRYAILVGEMAKKEDFDVIHAHDWLSYLAGVEAKKSTGKPLVIHVHATSFDQSGGREVDKRIFDIEKMAMEEADVVITVSKFTKDKVIEKHGINPDKIKVVHNGVLSLDDNSDDLQQHNILTLKEAGYNIVLYLGRLTIQKGPDYFIKAAKKTLEYEPNTIFIVAGSGEMENQMIREVAKLGIADKVLFAGFVRGEERNCLFRSADLFVMPSVSEPFGLVPLEALIEGGTPILISKQSGVSEVIKHALKVDFWDTDEMANKIVAILQNKALASQLSEYGKKEASKITWEKAATKCIKVYKDIIGIFKSKK